MAAVLPNIDLDKYTVEQRLQLIERIWQSIRENEFPVPDSHKQLIKQRLAEREQNPGADTPWEEAKSEILAESRDNADRR